MYGDIVPEDLQNELIRIRDSHTRQCFRVGEIVDEVITFNRTQGKTTELQHIYSAVALFAGRESRTVREYHAISRLFPLEIREHFHMLAFDHFRHAARLGGELSIQALQWAMEQTDELNRPATVDAMIARFSPPLPGEPDFPDELLQEGPAGLYSQIYRNVTASAVTAERWLASDIPDSVRDVLFKYLMACRAVIEVIPAKNQ